MSALVKRAVRVTGMAAVIGVASGLIWPGDLRGEPMTAAHWMAVGGFLTAAVLLFLAAGLVLFAIVGDAWKVENFHPDEYLENVRKDR